MMKFNHILTLCVALVTWSVTIAAPRGVWVETTHDFGTINENDGDAKCVMKLVNVGDEPLVIVKARASCGCTRPKYPKNAIAPGDTALIEVAYDPVGRPGRFSKKIHFDTNGEEMRSTLTISGVVIASDQTIKVRFPVDAGKMKLQKDILPLGEIKKGKAKSAFISAYNQSTDTLTPQWINLPEYLSVTTAPKAVPPGEQATLSFYLNTLKCDKWGFVSDTVYMIPEPGADTVAIEVAMTMVEDFSKMTPGQLQKAPAIAVTPERLDMGILTADETVSKEFVVENFGEDALLLRRVYTTDQGIDIKVDKEKIKKGKSAKITVTVNPKAVKNEIVNARITIVSNDPQRSQTIVRVVGEVKPQ